MNMGAVVFGGEHPYPDLDNTNLGGTQAFLAV